MPTPINRPTLPGAAPFPVTVAPPLGMQELADLLVRHYGLTEGRFDLVIEFNIGVGAVGPPDSLSPGISMGIARVGLTQASGKALISVNAASANPARKKTVLRNKK